MSGSSGMQLPLGTSISEQLSHHNINQPTTLFAKLNLTKCARTRPDMLVSLETYIKWRQRS
eukprot:6128610-Amphidinium_carterae.1